MKLKRKLFTVFAAFALTAGSLSLGLGSSPARATFPGSNGKILFSSSRTGTVHLWTMNPDGSNQRQLTSGLGSINGRWSGDGSQIVFQRGDGNIWRMKADGTAVTQLTFNSVFENVPSFSPDGSKIAYGSFPNNQREIRIMNSNGTGNTFVDFGTDPIFSPDGQRLAYMTPGGDVRVRNLGNNTFTDIVKQPGIDRPNDWSPDGTKLIFFHLQSVSSWHEVNVATRATTPIPAVRTAGQDSPVRYSPDGTRFLFQSERNEILFGFVNIFTVNTNGTDERQLTNLNTFNGVSDWQPAGSQQ